MNNQKPMGLLDVLAQQAGCAFLSDLHTARMHRALAELLPAFDAARYTAADWNEAVAYILGSPERFDDPLQARDFLCRRLLEG